MPDCHLTEDSRGSWQRLTEVNVMATCKHGPKGETMPTGNTTQNSSGISVRVTCPGEGPLSVRPSPGCCAPGTTGAAPRRARARLFEIYRYTSLLIELTALKVTFTVSILILSKYRASYLSANAHHLHQQGRGKAHSDALWRAKRRSTGKVRLPPRRRTYRRTELLCSHHMCLHQV